MAFSAGSGGFNASGTPEMTSTAYDQVLSHAKLSSVWKHLYKKTKPLSRNTTGIDGQSINDFHLDAKGNLVRLAKDIREKKFSFSSLKPYLVPKPSGKKRLICVPTVRDRIVQGALVDYLADKYAERLANNISFGFIKGRSVHMAARIACTARNQRPWVYKTDITSFFDSIPRADLREAIKKIIKERSLHGLLFSALDCEVDSPSRAVASDISRLGIKCGLGVRQGMPLSPLFSNLLLVDFDQKIELSGAHAVRYADDLIFLCKDQDECNQVAAFCKGEFNKIGLDVPAVAPGSKSIIYPPDRPAEFLGLELAPVAGRYELRLADAQLLKLKQELLGFSNIKQLLSRNITLRTLGQSIAAKRDGYLGAYDLCANIEEVELELKKAEHKALRAVYGAGLGIRLAVIGADARAFLGLPRKC
ncbi:reverse transcriptase domain-containing protein [Pseudoduganella plicata]|uniref:RNA-directed DNA polymerase n=1 Tax=Pseudoduganella plicata TaxID=321984 RepID=A0ABX5SEY4_9BURK|nr:reverse transcriptase domain-containing protein [Pseudoduganella plicata]QBQ38948.1 RNA-directed DNA polymerase [Pseudoduganella plicata]